MLHAVHYLPMKTNFIVFEHAFHIASFHQEQHGWSLDASPHTSRDIMIGRVQAQQIFRRGGAYLRFALNLHIEFSALQIM